MAGSDRDGRRRQGIGRYDEYNGFGEFDRDNYAGFDTDDRVMDALTGKDLRDDRFAGEEEYYEEDEYYDGDDEYYEEEPEDEYYEDEYYDDQDEYYEEEPEVRRKPAVKQKRPAKSPAGKHHRPAKSRGGSPARGKKAPAGKKRPQDEKPRKKGKVFLFVFEIVLFLALIVALFIVMKWDKVNKTELTESQIYVNDELKEALEGIGEDTEDTEADNWGMKNYKNVALFGVDAGGTRSDTIIIASINLKTNEVKMCSVYRDTYLNTDSMENPKYNKANSAYSKGGPEQAIRMLNMNLDMNVDDFITVDFDALEDIIDDLGGVEINVQPEEVDYINDYQFSIVMDLGGPNEGKIKNPRNFIAVTESGPQTLNGLQATAYCRIRYTAGSDFRRTERQREVISQIVKKAKGASLTQLNKILDDVLPQITTSFTAAEFAGYASKVGSYTIAETKGFPFENVTGNIGKQSMVVPDTLVYNVAEMHTFLFGTSGYTPTTTVQTISEKIENDRVANGL